ncbi:MAG: PRC-barrel domain-containing protein [Casimicrobium sp.]|jgi:hypothetical protein
MSTQSTAASSTAPASAPPAQAIAAIKDEISAIVEADVAATETDSSPWAVAEDEERHHEAEDLVAELKIQLQSKIEQPEWRKHAMLKSLSQITSAAVIATDGEIGQVKSALFDDQSWTIRFLVVETGTWLSGREVLISPYAVRQPMGVDSKNIDVSMTCEQVKGSPDIDTHQPVSRQHERDYLGYYGFPEYWGGGGMWGMGEYPQYLPPSGTPEEIAADKVMRQRELQAADSHLRSSAAVTSYKIQAADEMIGHVKDFIFDEASWAIRYLVVDTRNWWPGGKKVLVATHWIGDISWATATVHVKLTRDQVKNSPEYTEALLVDRDYEERLHEAHDRKGYWR